MNNLIPTPVLVLIGIGLVSLVIYADSQVDIMAVEWLKIYPNATLIDSNGFFDLDQFKEEHDIVSKDPPFFRTFAEEIAWYTQWEPTLMIEETNCDKLVTKYRAGDFEEKVNYSFRILEMCEI